VSISAKQCFALIRTPAHGCAGWGLSKPKCFAKDGTTDSQLTIFLDACKALLRADTNACTRMCRLGLIEAKMFRHGNRFSINDISRCLRSIVFSKKQIGLGERAVVFAFQSSSVAKQSFALCAKDAKASVCFLWVTLTNPSVVKNLLHKQRKITFLLALTHSKFCLSTLLWH